MRKLFFDNLPHKNNNIDWDRSIGSSIKFEYDGSNGYITIVNSYLDNERKRRIIEICYNNETFKVTSDTLLKCYIGKIVGKRKLPTFRYNIGDIIRDDKRDILITDRKYITNSKNHTIKMYKFTCKKCGWEDGWINEMFLYNGCGCSCCIGMTVVPGINDIPTTAPWMVPYFQGGYDEAKQYTRYSTKSIIPICPFCQKVAHREHKIYNIFQGKGFGCNCKDGISYPEKFVMSLFDQCGINYIYQACHTTLNWSENKKYDFYLPEYNCIIEVHGEQHYRDTVWTSLEYETNNDKYKKHLAISNGIDNYIEIDCRKSECAYITDSICKSDISNILKIDLSKIDFTKCDMFATSNIVKEICDYYSNVDNSVNHIAKHFNLYKSTISKYLNQGNKFGWCIPEYTGNKKPILVYKNGEYIGIYESASFLKENSKRLFNVSLDSSSITSVCKGRRKTHKGYIFKYANIA